MNKNIYRLIFSKARGVWVCVSEIAKSHRKGGRSSGRGKALLLMLILLGMLPSTGLAEIIVDPNAPANHRPGLDTSANKTPVINITAPNEHGVSHNEFSKFDVNMPGVILNNSRKDAVSQIGGYVLGNTNMAGGDARAALIEVNGQSASQINGAIEALGRKLDVFIANPSGITVNGLVTVNLNNLTLTTGAPQYLANGQLGFSVHGGQISITDKGVNTVGLSYFDLVARSVLLNAPISSADEKPADISVITGLNDYVADARSFIKRESSSANTPLWAIDGTTLGAMYGGLIRFVSTESGIGVRHNGLVLSVNDININSAGQIELSSRVQANGNVALDGKQISIGENAHIQATTLGLTASGDLVNAGLLTSEQDINIRSMLFSNTGQVGALGSLQLNVEALDNNGGLLQSGVDLDIIANTYINNRNNGKMDVKNDIRIKGTNFSNAELSTILARKGSMDFDLSGDASNAGRLMSSKTLHMKVGGDLLNQKTSTGTEAQDSALIYGTNGVSIDVAGDIHNQDSASIEAGDDSKVELIAKDLVNSNQAAILAGSVTIRADSLSNQQDAFIRASAEKEALLDIQLSGALSNTDQGMLLSANNLHINAGSVSNAGKDSAISASGKVEVNTTADISNTAKAQIIAADIELTAQALLNDDATIQSGFASQAGDMTIRLLQGLVNRNKGSILATGNADIAAMTLENMSRAQPQQCCG